MPPRLILIAAIDRKRLLANEHRIPWRLPADIAHFRAVTAGHWLLLGRRTYEEMTGWFTPAHIPLLLTRSTLASPPPHGHLVRSVHAALDLAAFHGTPCLYCCGGGATFTAALPYADTLLLTQIEHAFPAGQHPVYFPAWKPSAWNLTRSVHHPQDAENPWAFTINTWERHLTSREIGE